MELTTETKYFVQVGTFGASLEALENFLTFCAIQVKGNKKDRVTAIQAIKKWLEKQSS